MREAIKSKLKTHYHGHHKGKEPKWLQYDEIPIQCIYSNFEEYIKGQDKLLELKPGITLKKGGRRLGSCLQG